VGAAAAARAIADGPGRGAVLSDRRLRLAAGNRIAATPALAPAE